MNGLAEVVVLPDTYWHLIEQRNALKQQANKHNIELSRPAASTQM
jgi:hypothetical protein